uniref:Uncharacterized protein n=1 Tax=Caenorhabditis tropicalis TaxID=1561998 RepID=A0A1I7UGA1_9PELO
MVAFNQQIRKKLQKRGDIIENLKRLKQLKISLDLDENLNTEKRYSQSNYMLLLHPLILDDARFQNVTISKRLFCFIEFHNSLLFFCLLWSRSGIAILLNRRY